MTQPQYIYLAEAIAILRARPGDETLTRQAAHDLARRYEWRTRGDPPHTMYHRGDVERTPARSERRRQGRVKMWATRRDRA